MRLYHTKVDVLKLAERKQKISQVITWATLALLCSGNLCKAELISASTDRGNYCEVFKQKQLLKFTQEESTKGC